MANLNRRAKGKSASNGSIEALREEIDALKSLYQRDMNNISLDMQALNEQIQSAPVEMPTEPAPDA